MKIAEQHKAILDRAVKANHERTFYAQYPEHPSPKIYGETADKEGREWFQAMVGQNFVALKQANSAGWIGDEESPYLQEKLNISYPTISVTEYIENASQAFDDWRRISPIDRAGLLIESLERMKERFFRNSLRHNAYYRPGLYDGFSGFRSTCCRPCAGGDCPGL